MTGTLAGRVAVVTGAGSGIGRAAATLFAREGAAVAVIDLAEAAARETVAQITGTGGRVNVICPGTVYTPLMEPMLRARGGGDLAAGLAMTVAKYPIGRLGTPEEIAAVALFLAGDASSFLTGSVITAD